MPWPVRTNGFDPAWLTARADRAARAPGEPVRFLFIGGDFPRKGGPLLIRAWRDAGFGRRAGLDLVTDWSLDESLPDGIRVVRDVKPYTARWFDLWRRADVFVMPTRREAFGMVFQEAAIAGVPAIGTAINAIPELIDDGVTGLLVRPDHGRDLIGAMRACVESADLRLRMGAAARHRMLAIASPDRYAATLHDLIEDLVHTHAPQPV